jgi:Low affinity iron permease
LIRAVEGAHNGLLNLEDLGEKELDRIRANYIKLAEAARQPLLDKEDKRSENAEFDHNHSG